MALLGLTWGPPTPALEYGRMKELKSSRMTRFDGKLTAFAVSLILLKPGPYYLKCGAGEPHDTIICCLQRSREADWRRSKKSGHLCALGPSLYRCSCVSLPQQNHYVRQFLLPIWLDV